MIGEYQNGNYRVRLYEDGTMTRTLTRQVFQPDSPDMVAVHIGDSDPLAYKFWESIGPYREIDLFDDCLSSQHLNNLLISCQTMNAMVHLFVSLQSFLEYRVRISHLLNYGRIDGLHVHTNKYDEELDALATKNNAVHVSVSVGEISLETVKMYASKSITLDISGHKGKWTKEERQRKKELMQWFQSIVSLFGSIQVDNLAYRQLAVGRNQQKTVSEVFPDANLYLDLPNNTYQGEEGIEFHPISDSVKEMFQKTRGARDQHVGKDSEVDGV